MKNIAAKLSVGLLIIVILLALSFWTFSMFSRSGVNAEGKWVGVDETVIEKYAIAAGREPMEPLINTDQGDLPLFVFALAGAVGGFIAGYCWRMLMHEKKGGPGS
jgi:ABC-type cobalt transport system substrate-binding protein